MFQSSITMCITHFKAFYTTDATNKQVRKPSTCAKFSDASPRVITCIVMLLVLHNQSSHWFLPIWSSTGSHQQRLPVGKQSKPTGSANISNLLLASSLSVETLEGCVPVVFMDFAFIIITATLKSCIDIAEEWVMVETCHVYYFKKQ